MASYLLPKRALDKVVSATLIGLHPGFGGGVAMGLDMSSKAGIEEAGSYRERRISRGREFDLLKFRVLRREVLDRGVEGHARRLEVDPENLTWAGRRISSSGISTSCRSSSTSCAAT